VEPANTALSCPPATLALAAVETKDEAPATEHVDGVPRPRRRWARVRVAAELKARAGAADAEAGLALIALGAKAPSDSARDVIPMVPRTIDRTFEANLS
jgi:hypothetical protein